MSTLPASAVPASIPEPWLDADQATEQVMSECLRGSCFGPEAEFWAAFAITYAWVEAKVDPSQRFAFATRVDGRLVEMGLAPWSITSRLAAARAADGTNV